VAFAFVLAEVIPKVSHSTPLTNYLTFNYVVTALTALECFVAFTIISYDAEWTDFVISWEKKLVALIMLVDVIVFVQFYYRSRGVS